MKEEKFIQIGLKRKGRIVKNEQYTIEEFRKLMGGELRDYKPIPFLSIWKRIFNPKGVIRVVRLARERGIQEGWNDAINHVVMRINHLINSDDFGRKRKR